MFKKECHHHACLKVVVPRILERKKIQFAGDVKNGRHRQAAIAVGDGLNAAMEIYDRIVEM